MIHFKRRFSTFESTCETESSTTHSYHIVPQFYGHLLDLYLD